MGKDAVFIKNVQEVIEFIRHQAFSHVAAATLYRDEESQKQFHQDRARAYDWVADVAEKAWAEIECDRQFEFAEDMRYDDMPSEEGD